MQKSVLKDRRVFERIPVKLPLRYLDPHSSKEVLAQTHDISAKGIGLTTEKELSPYTRVEMWLQIPDQGEPLHVKGEVIWSQMLDPNRHRAGISLDNVDLMGISRVLRIV